MIEGLHRLRVRLTAWYIGVFGAILVGLGVALFFVVAREASAELDESLRKATDALVVAAEIRVHEGTPGPGRVDALNELRIPDRALYLFDERGVLIHPDTASDWIRRFGRNAVGRAAMLIETDLPDGSTARAYALPVRTSDGAKRIAVAAGEVLEIDRQYPGILLAFAAAVATALLLVGLGGWVLARRSIRPVDDAFTRMREFMADAAHELRTPVAVLKGHADVALRHPRESSEYVQTLTAMHAEASRLAGILANLLTLATADAGAWPERRESVFLDDILLDAAASARVLAAERDIRLELTALEEMPVRGDPDRLHQLFMILLDNAIKFTPRGGAVRLSARRVGPSGEVAVEDTGSGIPDDVLAHAFERFYRADRARTRGEGAGLGLPIARWIAQSHGGVVQLARAAPAGTVATVTLPLEEA